MVTRNGGSIWNSWTSTAYRSLNGISCASSSTCVAVGNQGTILVTHEGGASWHSQQVTTTSLQGVACVTSGLCVVVGSDGAILATGHASPAPVAVPTQPVRQTCPQGSGTSAQVMPVAPTSGTSLALASPVAFAWKPFCQATNYVLQVWLISRHAGPSLGPDAHVTFSTLVYHRSSYLWDPAGFLPGSYAYSLVPLDAFGTALALPSTAVTFTRA